MHVCTQEAIHPDACFDAADDWIRNLARGIVAFRLRISRLEGKFKLGQNRSVEDRTAAAAALSLSDRESERILAAMMAGK